LNNFLGKVVDCICDLAFPPARFETKLLRCQSYRSKTITRWQKKSGLTRSTTNRVLDQIQVFDSLRIRALIRNAAEARADIFRAEHCYITSFGPTGKSGEVIFYEFRNSLAGPRKMIESWQVTKMPPESTIVFVDDLIGTGTQSLGYIEKRLNAVLAPSHKPFLFSICGTPAGINRVRQNSRFDVICALELRDDEFNHYHDSNTAFSSKEKEQLRRLNGLLGQNSFDLGLLLAFYYSTPNNTMPLIWKEGWKYTDDKERPDSWFALLPRSF
jgi:hypothetical protein